MVEDITLWTSCCPVSRGLQVHKIWTCAFGHAPGAYLQACMQSSMAYIVSISAELSKLGCSTRASRHGASSTGWYLFPPMFMFLEGLAEHASFLISLAGSMQVPPPRPLLPRACWLLCSKAAVVPAFCPSGWCFAATGEQQAETAQCRKFLSMPAACALQVTCIFDKANIWANLQSNRSPWLMSWDLENAKCWRPFFTKKFQSQHDLGTVQPDIRWPFHIFTQLSVATLWTNLAVLSFSKQCMSR